MQNSQRNEVVSEGQADVMDFFQDAGREAVLDQLQRAVEDGVPFLSLTAEKGSGKSTLCRMLGERLEENIQCIYLPADLESFEDVARIIVEETDVVIPEEYAEQRMGLQLELVRKYLEKENRRILVIFDEAEKLYLATMERARKMLDVFNARQETFQLLFSGQPLLQDSLKRLELVEFEGVEELHLSLEPLTSDEVQSYLYLRYDSLGDEELHKLFPEKKCNEIAKESYGVIGKINELGDTYLAEQVGDEASAVTEQDDAQVIEDFEEVNAGEEFEEDGDDLQEFVEVDEDEPADLVAASDVPIRQDAQEKDAVPAPKKKKKKNRDRRKKSGFPGRLFLLILLLGAGVVVLYFLNIARQETTKSNVQVDLGQQQKTVKKVASKKTTEKQVIEKADKKQNEIIKKEEKDASLKPVVSDVVSVEVSEQAVVKQQEKAAVDAKKESVVVEKAAKQTEEKKTEVIEKKQDIEAVAKQTAAEKEKAVKKPVAAVQDAVSDLQAQAPETDSAKGIVAKPVDNNAIETFETRLEAGSIFLAGEKNEQFSVQVMALTSENSEANLRSLLNDKEYQDILGELYILRAQKGYPIFVLYGQYETLAEARQGRNTIPLVLREYKPYPVKIGAAVEKVKE